MVLSDLERRIAEEVRARGPIPFARFMERALYEPGLGYYARDGSRVGRAGDFVTSPSLAPAFGRTLARLLGPVHDAVGRPERMRVVDAGAGEGGLLAPLLGRLGTGADRPQCEVEAVVVERGDGLRARAVARAREAGFEPVALDRIGGLVRLAPLPGMVLANELLDALPVRRLRRTRDRLEEAHVGLDGERLVELWRETDDAVELPPLPEGREYAVAVGMGPLLAELGGAVSRGLVLVIDYGYPRSVLHAGTGPGAPARGFRRGSLVQDLLAAPGEVDLTAHVDFTAAARAAGACGLEVLFFCDQTYLLLALGFLDDPDAGRAKRLVLPDDMGGSFKCLALGKGIGSGTLGLEVRDRSRHLGG